MAIRQPAYVEAWDALEFPALDPHSSDISVPLFHQRVALVRGVAAPGTPDEGEETWLVVRGHALVAYSMSELAAGEMDHVSDINRWLADARTADDADKDWHRRWEDRLNYSPRLVEALEHGSAEVFARAGLTAFQMRAVELMLDGKTKTEIGHALGLTRQAATERIDVALEKILALDDVSA